MALKQYSSQTVNNGTASSTSLSPDQSHHTRSPDHSQTINLPVVKISGKGTSLSVYSPYTWKRSKTTAFSLLLSPQRPDETHNHGDNDDNTEESDKETEYDWRHVNSRGYTSSNLQVIPRLPKAEQHKRLTGLNSSDSGVDIPVPKKSPLTPTYRDVTCENYRCSYSSSITLPVIEEILADEGFSDVSITQQLKLLRGKEECVHRSLSNPHSSSEKTPGKSHYLSPLSLKSPRCVTNNSSTPTSSPTIGSKIRPLSSQGICHDNVDATPGTISPRSHTNLTKKRGKRHGARYKPWTAAYSVMGQPLDDGWKEELYICQSDIEKTKWLSEQQLERGLMGKIFIPPRILLVSSKVNKANLLISSVVKREEYIICIPYDYDTSTLEDIMYDIRKKLEEYKHGARAKSVMLYCQGGPGYLYMLRKKVLTPQKLKKEGNQDMTMFWRELGTCMSKVPPEESVIYIMGCYVLGDKQGYQLFQDLKQIIQPNIVRLECPMDRSAAGKRAIDTYFDSRRYELWKTQQHSSNDELDWTLSETVDSTEDLTVK